MEWSSSQQNMFNNRSSQDSAVGSGRNSFPFQDSQSSGLSQIATQDVFSQGICTPRNQIEASKPSSMYEKWKSRQAMMKRDVCIAPQGVAVGQAGIIPGSMAKMPYPGLGRWDSKSSINSVCTTAGISGNRGKLDSDERKLMEQMICMTRDCNNDVKSTLLALMEHLDKMRDLSDDQLSKSMSSFLEKLWAHEESLKKLIQEQNATNPTLDELKTSLAKKDVQISSLEDQLAEAKGDGSQRFTEDVKLGFQSLQSTFMGKQEKCEALIKEGREKDAELMEDWFNNIHDQQKKNEALFKALKTGMKDSEKRMISEFSKLIQKMESKMLSHQKESAVKMKDMIVKDVKNGTSNCAQSENFNNWASTLENTFRKGFSDMLHSLEQLIERRLKTCKERNDAGRKAEVRSVGTFTDNEARLEHPRPNFIPYTGFDNRQIGRPSNSTSLEHYSANKSRGNEQQNKCVPATPVQEMHYVHQMPHQNIQPHSQNAKYPSYEHPGCSSVERSFIDRDLNLYRGESNLQQKLYVGSANRNAFSKNGNSLQYGMKSFDNPFTKPVPPFSTKKGPSPCAVVEPRRPEIEHKINSEVENMSYNKRMSQDTAKPGCKKRRKSVYTRKKNCSSKKKCSIEGLSPLKESFLHANNVRSQRALKQTPQSMQYVDKLQQITNTCAIQKPEKTYLTPRGQVITTGRNSIHTGTFDPYSFDEPDPQAIPNIPRTKVCDEDGFTRPQTRSYWGSLADKKKNLLVTPKVPIATLNSSVSPQSSPSVSVVNMTIERKVRTPFKGFRSRIGPQGLSTYRVPNMNWKASNNDSPKTLLSLSDM